MKINAKLYEVANEVQPFEVQKLEKRTIELFYMSDFNGVEEEFVRGKGQFATWASLDGVDYRLFIEKGYYEAVKSLYSKEVNEIWINFWDEADAIYQNFSKKFMIPLMVGVLALTIGCMFIPNYGTYVMMGLLIAVIITYMIGNRIMKKKTMMANVSSREAIVNLLGQKNFDKLIDNQKDYMDSYFDKANEESDDLDEEEATEDEADENSSNEATEDEASEDNEKKD